MIKLLYPIPMGSIITQSYAQHVENARKHGWCSKPGTCPSGIYYYGGIDWGIPVGTQILAAMAGAAIKVEDQGKTGYGKHVRLQHDGGYITIYGHLSMFDAAVGDLVKAGDLIGRSGNTGNSSGPHLHFELRKNGVPENPAPYLVSVLANQPDSAEQTVSEVFAKGDHIRLKSKFDYVNIRPRPDYGPGVPDWGDFLPGDEAIVAQTQDEMVCIFELKGIALWVHKAYVEKIG